MPARTPMPKQGVHQNWQDVMSLQHLSGKIIWSLIVIFAGTLLVSSFGSKTLGSEAALTAQNVAPVTSTTTAVSLTPNSYPTIINIRQYNQEGQGLIIEATADQDDVSWKNVILSLGQQCDWDTFNLIPNHPATPDHVTVNYSNRHVIPASEEAQNKYRNHWVCFVVANAGGAQDYRLARVNLDNPAITVVRQEENGQEYLQASSDESVSWRIGLYESPGGMGGGGAGRAGHFCEKIFYGFGLDINVYNFQFSEIQLTNRVPLNNDGAIYCFEAVDIDGNRSYVSTGSYAGTMWTSQWQGKVSAFLSSTTGPVSWRVIGPLETSACNANIATVAFVENWSPGVNWTIPSIHPYNSLAAQIPLNESDHGKYYCFAAQEPLGSTIYSSTTLAVDLQAPNITIQARDDTLTGSADEDGWILNWSTIGPLESGDADCSEISLHTHPYSYQYGNTVTLDAQKDNDKYYCFYAEDNAGNESSLLSEQILINAQI